MKKLALIILMTSLFLFHSERARAISFMDAALTVGIGAGVGAVLGLSTLPFYEDSGAHTGNIWTGAAIGAVIGVGIAAFSAVSAEDSMHFEEEYEEADKKDFSFLFRSKKKFLLTAKAWQRKDNNLLLTKHENFPTVPEFRIWSPIATIYF